MFWMDFTEWSWVRFPHREYLQIRIKMKKKSKKIKLKKTCHQPKLKTRNGGAELGVEIGISKIGEDIKGRLRGVLFCN